MMRTPSLAALYLLMGGSFGLWFLVVTPPFCGSDEASHLARAWQVSQGHLLGEANGGYAGGTVPVSLYESYARLENGIRHNRQKRGSLANIRQEMSRPLLPDSVRFSDFRNTVLYSPVLYLPQSLVLRLGTTFGLGPLALMYAARLAMLVACLLLGAWALHSVPPGTGSLLFAVLLLPLGVFQPSVANPDGLQLALAMLWVAKLWQFGQRARTLSAAQLFVLAALAAALGLAKPVYLPLLLLVFWLPAVCWGGRLGLPARLGFLLIILPAMAMASSWNAAVQPLYRPYLYWLDVDAHRQWATVLQQPMAVLHLLLSETLAQAAETKVLLLGVLGDMDTYLPAGYYRVADKLLVLLALVAPVPFFMGWRQRGLAVLVALLAVLAVLLSLYLSYTPVGAQRLEGNFGRYYLPILPVALLALGGLLPGLRRWAPALAVLMALLGLSLSAWEVYFRYWG